VLRERPKKKFRIRLKESDNREISKWLYSFICPILEATQEVQVNRIDVELNIAKNSQAVVFVWVWSVKESLSAEVSEQEAEIQDSRLDHQFKREGYFVLKETDGCESQIFW
jgi:hypothetical protein